jgi:transcriptional regulator with XRE-family HTH domain
VDSLIEALKQKQTDLKLNETDFAHRIGVSRAMWFQVKLGSREPGNNVLAAVEAEFPEMGQLILDYLKEKGKARKVVA